MDEWVEKDVDEVADMTERIRKDGKFQFFTVVYRGDLREIEGNPFKTFNPFGAPYRIAMGDALEELDQLLHGKEMS